MPILRAGPWGNLTDSFQPVPGATDTLLYHYPVNCAKANWPNQTWAAYYELTEVAGCCTPETLSIYWWVFTGTIEFEVSRTEEGGCQYYYYDSGSWTFSLTWDESAPWYPQWYAETDAYYGDSGYGQGTNPCDPTNSSNDYTTFGALSITIPT